MMMSSTATLFLCERRPHREGLRLSLNRSLSDPNGGRDAGPTNGLKPFCTSLRKGGLVHGVNHPHNLHQQSQRGSSSTHLHLFPSPCSPTSSYSSLASPISPFPSSPLSPYPSSSSSYPSSPCSTSSSFTSPPKRFKLEPVAGLLQPPGAGGGGNFPFFSPACSPPSSLASSPPTSPLSDAPAVLTRALLLERVRAIKPADLAERLSEQSKIQKQQPEGDGETSPGGCSTEGLLLIDCRPFLSYNVNHIRGAINVKCSDRFNRRRLQMGKAVLADLATTAEGKARLRGTSVGGREGGGEGGAEEDKETPQKTPEEVVVYDEATAELDSLPPTHPILLVLAALANDQRWEPAFLIGECHPFFLFFQ
ncbi:hypothetical protein J437_LFUL014532 [Ladona fulva]|uniref:Rhodanese domain-containing protein n=1 Tax=Ladona fulva TaxID=123851 RepID=A0A8K0K488_LADFU|nr:hypothetical protein J437_LFUL014532 [Ladona fulva]